MQPIELWHGDCLELRENIPDGSVDLVLADPPYGMAFKSNYRKEKYNEIKNDKSLEWLEKYVGECFRILKYNTAVYFFCSWHNVDVFKQAIEKKFKIKNILIWEKNNTSMGDLKASYAPKYEMIIFAHKGRKLLNGFRYADIIKANRTGNKLHPTEKPVDLLELFIKNSSDENAVVFDGFMGSGSTGVACVNTNRRFIGIELDEGYFNIAKKRIEEAIQGVFDMGVLEYMYMTEPRKEQE